VTRRHVRRLVIERRVPCLPVGRFIRFDAADISAWLDRREGRHNLDQGPELAARAATSHHGPWPSPFCTSGCAGSCRSWPCPAGARWTKTSSLWSCVTRCAPSSANFTAVSSTEGPTAPSWLPSAGSFLGTEGRLSWSRQRRCSVGTERPDGGSGGHGGRRRGPGRPPMSPQLGRADRAPGPGEPYVGLCTHPGRAAKAPKGVRQGQRRVPLLGVVSASC
jgi:hypothetical protein